MRKNLIIVGSIVLACTFLLSACGAAGKLEEYDFAPDKVASINAVIGESRKVSGVSTGIENSKQYKQYTYATPSMASDLSVYLQYLMDEGWIVLTDIDLSGGRGVAELGIESADSGKILIMTIDFQTDRYSIRIEKDKGALIRY